MVAAYVTPSGGRDDNGYGQSDADALLGIVEALAAAADRGPVIVLGDINVRQPDDPEEYHSVDAAQVPSLIGGVANREALAALRALGLRNVAGARTYKPMGFSCRNMSVPDIVLSNALDSVTDCNTAITLGETSHAGAYALAPIYGTDQRWWRRRPAGGSRRRRRRTGPSAHRVSRRRWSTRRWT